jgi:ankyrin repeat protein
LYAAWRGHEVVVKLLLATNHVDINSNDNNGQTPLSLSSTTKQEWWIKNSNFEAVMDLLFSDNYIDMNSRNANGRTSLSWVARERHLTRVELLFAKKGINRDIEDNVRHTALWWVEKNGHDVMKILNDTT